MNTWALVQTLINGVLAGGTYALLAVGTTVIYGVMRMVNFANSAFFVAGLYFTWWGHELLGWNIYALIPFMAVMLGGLAYAVYMVSLMPILNQPRTSSIIVTVGLTFFLQNLMILLFTAKPLNIPSSIQRATLQLGEFVVPAIRLIAFLAAIVLSVLLGFVLMHTNFGRCLRSTSENREVAEMLGIDSKRMYVSAWTIGIILTGLAGLLLAPMYNIKPDTGNVFRSTALIACVLGGLGNVKGAFISGIALGLVEALTSVFVAQELGPAGIFFLFLVALRFKPQGLFGKGERLA